ncbi:hypothetical protein EJ05DRAFT_471849 [Pseudovirgaria hyperparasitica]|uniref:C2H2-type domain-containing protein n=1 Tax=Pseudovirgaria hyperparasitica TaxID=470096 RepID=A0A6A6WL06_9PEZI|nr:uncharacterized protein EJ05DRAFT_471849 [Pseudovirgaria hyperparasitica]KAF2762885.1 hypothetical protein EJ05DRAFT_471849 [Pseudovirgaria hyperparasitica]
MPYVAGYDRSHNLFICCNWLHVLASRDIKDALRKPVPPAFGELCKSLQPKSNVSVHIVYNDEDDFSYIPEELAKRYMVPIQCGMCEVGFDSWDDRMRHRRDEHKISEEYNPLPDC